MLYYTLAFCASAKQVQRLSAYSSTSSCLQEQNCFPSWTAGVIDPGHGPVKNRPDFILYWNKLCLEGGCQIAQHYLTHPAAVYSQLCALVGLSHHHALLFSLGCRPGTFYSPALVSDILTRSHKTCHRREGGRQNARILESTHKEKQATPAAILITHNHVNAAHYTHMHACMHSVTWAL